MKVSLFVTCLVDQLWSSVGASTVTVLRRAGCEVEFDERQTCCAQPAFNTGYRDGQHVSPRPWPLYDTPWSGLSGAFVPAIRPSLCVAHVAARPGFAAFKYVTECPPQLPRRSGRLPR